MNSDVLKQVRSQHVRFLTDSIKYAQANCVDGTVLLASIFQRIGLHTGLILVPGHMFLEVAADPDNQTWFHIETTMLGSADIYAAIRKGTQESTYWNSSERKGKIIAIEIQKARNASVVPIAR